MTKFTFRHALCFAALMAAGISVSAERLVILHTNDTHSQIEPTEKGRGGISARKAIIDSVRNVNDNVILVDAGDMVQGTLYFTLFGGEVESKLMNYLDYDIQILGNHEFDNGVNSLAGIFGKLKAERLSTNYDFTDTPLAPLFKPYLIKEIDGRKIGFIAINLDPKGMISDKNSRGVVYLDAIKAANSTAWHLRHNEKVDMVIALTHIGYSEKDLVSDVDLARESEDIDIIIGGHSHTVIDPAAGSPDYLVPNRLGKPVLVAQTGKSGINIGEIDIDLDDFKAEYKLIPVFADAYNADPGLDSILKPYRAEVERYRNFKIGKTPTGLKVSDWSSVNWMADFVAAQAATLTDSKIDMAIVNKGGVRADIPSGDITKGTIMQVFPFDNRIVVLDVPGKTLLEALDVMASRNGDGVSEGVDITYDPKTGKCIKVMIGGKPLDEDRIYKVATIDYLARGGDYMAPLTGCAVVAESGNVIYDDMINTLSHSKKPVKANKTVRMHPSSN